MIKKGIPCKSGAVPAAVSPLKVFELHSHCPAAGWEGNQKQDKPEDLP